jgi:putative transposase
MIYEFILRNEFDYPVEKMCEYLKVTKSSFYHWSKKRDLISPSSEKTLLLTDRILFLFKDNKEIYGSYRIHKLLEREGVNYSRSYIAKKMRELGLKSVLRRKYVITTDSNSSLPVVKNILDGEFNSLELGKKWISGINYIRVNNDWNYFTTIIDLANRKFVGWTLSEDMTKENTVMKA